MRLAGSRFLDASLRATGSNDGVGDIQIDLVAAPPDSGAEPGDQGTVGLEPIDDLGNDRGGDAPPAGMDGRQTPIAGNDDWNAVSGGYPRGPGRPGR